MSGANQFFSVLMDAAVLACPFPRPSLVVKYNQLHSEMRNVRACYYDVTTRMLCFCGARQLSTDLESLEISCRQENSRSHIFVFVVTADTVVACVLLHACCFVSHPSLCTAQGRIIIFWTLCLKTFHLGTVGVCLAWSSLLPQYCCCVDCLHCDLDT